MQSTNEQDSEVMEGINEQLPEFFHFLANRGLKMFHQNIRGLDLHKTELEELVESFRGIDLLGLSETHLNETTTEEVKFKGYNFEQKDRTSGKGGGVSVYIKETQFYYPIRKVYW